jgi:hypothetical protein
MRKIAFFVEGQTEQIFIDRLVRELFGYSKVSIILKQAQGGSNMPRQELVRKISAADNPAWQALICDCGADNRVKSEILDNLPNLVKAGYSYIIGVRDLYPMPVNDLPRLKAGLKFLPPRLSRRYADFFEIIVVVQEVETWFLAENHHFRRVDRRLTGQYINHKLGFNPYVIDPTARKHPSKDLNSIYQLVGRSYSKKYMQVLRLVNKLDFDHIFRHLRYSVPSLGELLGAIERITKKK